MLIGTVQYETLFMMGHTCVHTTYPKYFQDGLWSWVDDALYVSDHPSRDGLQHRRKEDEGKHHYHQL